MNPRRPLFVVLLLCCTLLLPYFCSGAVKCLHGVTLEGGFVNETFEPSPCADRVPYCRKTLCKSGNGKEWNTWGCYMNNDGPDCERKHVQYATREIQKSEWQCECSFGEKHEEMAFTLPPTPAPVTTTTKKPTKAPKPTTTTTKPSKGRRFVAEVPLALGLPMLLGILPFFHDMFAMLYGHHIN
ncbi:hypothetical protein GPALN_010582 [Globodera pallida]|nr:hypothetical protein GPALN_010582 [Globodera pallida]